MPVADKFVLVGDPKAKGNPAELKAPLDAVTDFLTATGDPLPGGGKLDSDVRAALSVPFKKALKKEILTDPMGVGYSGKTVPQIIALLFAAPPQNRLDAPRYCAVISGIPFAPNNIDLTDVPEIQS